MDVGAVARRLCRRGLPWCVLPSADRRNIVMRGDRQKVDDERSQWRSVTLIVALSVGHGVTTESQMRSGPGMWPSLLSLSVTGGVVHPIGIGKRGVSLA
jgi:hypothetical protein